LLKSGANGVFSTFEKKNSDKIADLFDKAKKEAIPEYRLVFKNPDKTPKPPSEIVKLHETALVRAQDKFISFLGIFKADSQYDLYFRALRDELHTIFEEQKRLNEEYITFKLQQDANRLLLKFRQSVNVLQIPMDEADLKKIASHLMVSIIDEMKKDNQGFVAGKSYPDEIRKFEAVIQREVTVLEQKNVEEFHQSVKLLLDTVKDPVQRIAREYWYVKSYKAYVHEFLKKNFDLGQARNWKDSLKTKVIDTFIEKEFQKQISGVQFWDTIASSITGILATILAIAVGKVIPPLGFLIMVCYGIYYMFF